MLRSILFALALAAAFGCNGAGDPTADAPPDAPPAGVTPPTSDAPPRSDAPPTTTGPTTTVDPSAPAQRLRVSVIERYPHDPSAFTEGLLLADGVLYESTGLEGASTVRRVELRTGAVTASRPQPADVFGEGLALVGDELIQLSWRNGLAFTYDRDTLQPIRQFRYTGEGWGLCYDGESLWQSDGTATLRRRDPETFEQLGAVDVRDGAAAVVNLNELECVDGAIYANVWLTSELVRIDPSSGKVTARIDASSIVPPVSNADDVLNGIAHDPADGTFLLTGKRWPTLYRVRFEPVG